MTSGHGGHDEQRQGAAAGGAGPSDGVRTISHLEAAAFLGVSDRQVRRLVHGGQLEGAGEGRVTVPSVEKRAGRSMSVPAPTENNERMVYVSADYIENLVLQAAAGRDAATRLIEYRGQEHRAEELAAEVERLKAELEARKKKHGFWTRPRRLLWIGEREDD